MLCGCYKVRAKMNCARCGVLGEAQVRPIEVALHNSHSLRNSLSCEFEVMISTHLLLLIMLH
jgi:hypothetical protein